jgi:hypothetical protein
MGELHLNRNDKLILDNDWGANTYIKQDHKDTVYLYRNNQIAFSYDGQSFGINTSGGPGTLEIQSDHQGKPIVLNLTNKSDIPADPCIGFRIGSSPVNKFILGVDDSDQDKFKISAGNALGEADRLVIDSGGNIGIGTSSPAKTLHINGSLRIDDTTVTQKADSGDFLPINVNGAQYYLKLFR